MGACFSPLLVNLYMVWWEENYLFYLPTHVQVLFYGGYIDDLLIIWDSFSMNCATFVCLANNNSLNLEFSYDSHNDTIHFLDLTLIGDVVQGNVTTHTYRKERAGKLLLLASSCHSAHTKQSIPIWAFTRARHNCSTEESFNKIHNSMIYVISVEQLVWPQRKID